MASKTPIEDEEEAPAEEQLSAEYGVPIIHLADFEVDPDVIDLVPRSVCEDHCLIPVNRAGNTLIIAMRDPSDDIAFTVVRAATGLNVEAVVSTEAAIRAAIARYHE